MKHTTSVNRSPPQDAFGDSRQRRLPKWGMRLEKNMLVVSRHCIQCTYLIIALQVWMMNQRFLCLHKCQRGVEERNASVPQALKLLLHQIFHTFRRENQENLSSRRCYRFNLLRNLQTREIGWKERKKERRKIWSFCRVVRPSSQELSTPPNVFFQQQQQQHRRRPIRTRPYPPLHHTSPRQAERMW